MKLVHERSSLGNTVEIFVNVLLSLSQVEDQVETKMKDAMMNYGKPDYDGVTRSWDTVQRDVCTFILVYKNPIKCWKIN